MTERSSRCEPMPKAVQCNTTLVDYKQILNVSNMTSQQSYTMRSTEKFIKIVPIQSGFELSYVFEVVDYSRLYNTIKVRVPKCSEVRCM